MNGHEFLYVLKMMAYVVGFFAMVKAAFVVAELLAAFTFGIG